MCTIITLLIILIIIIIRAGFIQTNFHDDKQNVAVYKRHWTQQSGRLTVIVTFGPKSIVQHSVVMMYTFINLKF